MNIDLDALSAIVERLRLKAGIFTEAEYCGGAWAVDTSGTKAATFHLVQDGDCWLHMPAEQPQRLNPGDLVFFPRDARHLLAPCDTIPEDVAINPVTPPDPDAPQTRMLCGYFEFLSPARWPLLDELPEVVVLGMDRTVADDGKRLIDLILSESALRQEGCAAVLQQLSYVLLIYLLRKGLAGQQRTGLLSALNDAKVGRALKLIHGQPHQRWTLAGLAAAAGMSRASFAARFHDLVGQPAMQYLAAWRMQVAVDLLSNTNDSMAAIAETVGYTSEAAFRNAFSREMGESPGRLRRRMQSRDDTR